MKLQIKIGSPNPENINKDEVYSVIPFGTAEIEVVNPSITVYVEA
jgi:uncharacterized protein (TIGR02058 family)